MRSADFAIPLSFAEFPLHIYQHTPTLLSELNKFMSAPFMSGPPPPTAAIVRIMKARKTLTHSLLISELFQQANVSLHTSIC